jgi:ABC-type sulfate/molybdate transport systems ATPase subunit
MREELKRLQRELAISFIHVTQAMALADLMVVMEDGHIRQAGAPREVFERRASAVIARFIGGHNVLPGEHGLIAVRADRCRLAARTSPAVSRSSNIRAPSFASRWKPTTARRQPPWCRMTHSTLARLRRAIRRHWSGPPPTPIVSTMDERHCERRQRRIPC